MEIPESPAERQFKTRELVKKLIEALQDQMADATPQQKRVIDMSIKQI
jgi:hypothetical protein